MASSTQRYILSIPGIYDSFLPKNILYVFDKQTSARYVGYLEPWKSAFKHVFEMPLEMLMTLIETRIKENDFDVTLEPRTKGTIRFWIKKTQ